MRYIDRTTQTHDRRRTLPASILALGLVGSALVGCGVSSEREARSTESSSAVSGDIADALAAEGEIKVVDSGFQSATLQATLMAELIERMGGQASLVKLTDYLATWPAVARDSDMVAPEIWDMFSQAQIQEYVEEKKTVVNLGTSPIKGEEGWYVPTYVIEGDAERGIEPMCPGLPDWEALNECADLFATPETEPRGRYLLGNAADIEYYGDEQRIESLGLDYETVVAGSEAALVAELKRAYDRGEPWLGLMWRPHYATGRYDMTLIEFPPYSDECWGDSYACSWDELNLIKIAGSEFVEEHPLGAEFVENFALNSEQLATMTIAMEEDGKSAAEVVEAWVEANPEVWQNWVPQP